MSCIKALYTAAKRIGIVLLVLGVGLFAASCGKDGKIYGAVIWDGTLYAASIGGFPSSGYYGTYYEISPGTYDVYYTLWDGLNYYPGYWVGHGEDPSYYWICSYTVEAENGSFPLVDGKDKTFALYLAYDGMYKGGDVKNIETPVQRSKGMTPKLGTQSWTENGLLITVTSKIAKLTHEEFSKLNKSQMQKQ